MDLLDDCDCPARTISDGSPLNSTPLPQTFKHAVYMCTIYACNGRFLQRVLKPIRIKIGKEIELLKTSCVSEASGYGRRTMSFAFLRSLDLFVFFQRNEQRSLRYFLKALCGRSPSRHINFDLLTSKPLTKQSNRKCIQEKVSKRRSTLVFKMVVYTLLNSKVRPKSA